MKLDHIGFVVKDIEKSRQSFLDIFCLKQKSDRIIEPAHNVEIVFFETGHGQTPMIELIVPLSKDSKVSGFLEKTGGGLHHLAYEVPDLTASIAHFQSNGSLLVGDVVPGAGHSNQPTVWLYTPDRSLVELIEEGHHNG